FNRAHVNTAICAPCRAIIATGRYGHRSGAMGFMPAREEVPDLVTTLNEAGYHTGILGKQEHSTPKKTIKWDYAFDQKDLGNGRSPKLYYERSVTFLKQAKEAGKPFYFMVNSHDPHRPYCNPDKLTKGAEMPSKIYRAEEVTVPGFLPNLPGVRREFASYLNSTRRLDDTFGRVMDAIEETGFADSTLVLFITDNGLAMPFAKCNTWYHATRTPLLVRWPGVVKPGTPDDENFVSVIDFFPTFMEATQVEAPAGLDGQSFLPLLKREQQKGRSMVFTTIDSKAGGDYVPMRAVQNAKFGYIYNPFSDDRFWYRNNNEGLAMKAMNEAAESDPAIKARVDLFRYRVPEEFYDLEEDPDCLNNLIHNPEYNDVIAEMQAELMKEMERTEDPMLEAFQNKDDRAKVDAVMEATYGKRGKGKQKKSRGYDPRA
ncbi:MAG: sulfatase, partial [Verrucomicrobiota bacterium]